MGLFKTKEEHELDEIIARINMNMSNNYKDAAQKNFQELEAKFNEMKENGTLKAKLVPIYESRIGVYKEKLKGYTHKDQKPYWT